MTEKQLKQYHDQYGALTSLRSLEQMICEALNEPNAWVDINCDYFHSKRGLPTPILLKLHKVVKKEIDDLLETIKKE